MFWLWRCVGGLLTFITVVNVSHTITFSPSEMHFCERLKLVSPQLPNLPTSTDSDTGLSMKTARNISTDSILKLTTSNRWIRDRWECTVTWVRGDGAWTTAFRLARREQTPGLGGLDERAFTWSRCLQGIFDDSFFSPATCLPAANSAYQLNSTVHLAFYVPFLRLCFLVSLSLLLFSVLF